MYFNAYDPVAGIGGFFRLGNRANEGTGEMTVCLYLPDGRVAFMFQRPEVTTNDAFDAAGLRFEVVTPFEELRVAYRGEVLVLDDPLVLVDPRRAFTTAPRQPCTVTMVFSGRSTPFGGEPDERREAPGEEFARGHYEQLVEARGTVDVGPDHWELAGFGLRDHSWGPRTWQAPWYYRWLTGNVGPDTGFMVSRIAQRAGPGTRGGFVWEGGVLHLCDHAEVATRWEGEDRYHAGVDATLRSGDRRWHVAGQVLRMVPLRNRRRQDDGQLLVTRISEGLTRWTLDDGRVGYGWSEYLDQMVDGQPVGLAE